MWNVGRLCKAAEPYEGKTISSREFIFVTLGYFSGI